MFGKKINNQPKPKQFTLTDEELMELNFHDRLKKEREMEMRFWDLQLNLCRQRILERLALKPEEFQFNWQEVYSTKTLLAYKTPPPKPVVEEPKKEENGKKV